MRLCSGARSISGTALTATSDGLPIASRWTLPITAQRKCVLTGKTANNGFKYSFSHKRNKNKQNINLQQKSLYWERGQRWISLKICSKAIRTMEKVGLEKMAKEAGIDLWKLPFKDARPERLQYKEEHPMEVPLPKPGPYAIKNPEKIARSKKKPLKGIYLPGGRIEWTRDY